MVFRTAPYNAHAELDCTLYSATQATSAQDRSRKLGEELKDIYFPSRSARASSSAGGADKAGAMEDDSSDDDAGNELSAYERQRARTISANQVASEECSDFQLALPPSAKAPSGWRKAATSS